jgi:hypothetical protein
MDKAVIKKFVEIFGREGDWSKSHRFARRAGIMIFLHPHKDHDWVTGVKYDPDLFVFQTPEGVGFDGHTPMAWRRDFVEKVVALGGVPNLEEYPSVREGL